MVTGASTSVISIHLVRAPVKDVSATHWTCQHMPAVSTGHKIGYTQNSVYSSDGTKTYLTATGTQFLIN